jgi:hypothetical protein
MAYSIDLDRQARFGAIEVKYIGTDWMLTAKNWFSRQTHAESSP